MRHLFPLATVWLAACSDRTLDSGATPRSPTLTIVSPIDGVWLDEGADTVLSAVGRDASGSSVALDELLWSTEGWEITGNDVTVTDLPAGNITLSAEIQIDGQAVADSVELSVFAADNR